MACSHSEDCDGRAAVCPAVPWGEPMTKRWKAEGVQRLAQDLLAERDALRTELTALSRELEAARECHVEKLQRARRAEAEVARLRAAVRDVAASCLHVAGWCARCDGLRALAPPAAQEPPAGT